MEGWKSMIWKGWLTWQCQGTETHWRLGDVQDMVFNLSLRMLGTVPDAEDACQEILIKVMTHLSDFRKESRFSTWVFRIAVNHLRDYKKGMFAQRPLSFEVYGEDIATLAGDALLTAAFRYVTMAEADPAQVLRCVSILSQAAGETGMVAGQILDLEGEKRALSEEELRLVHRHKTGDMIRAACQMGAVLGGGSEEAVEAAGQFALRLGLAFQIRDDMLDCMGSQEELGKPIGSDAENGKSTFVTLFGLDACQTMVEQETQAALCCLEKGGFGDTAFIRALARELTARRK